MSLDLDALERVAQAATPGPWQTMVMLDSYEGEFEEHGVSPVAQVRFWSDSDMAHTALDTMEKVDSEHIAAFNPVTALALIAEIRELRQAVQKGVRAEHDAATAVIERVRAMHRPESIERYAWCVECSTDEYPEYWPCPTIAALDGAPEPEEGDAEYQAGCGSWDCRAPECGRA